jgi:hypothetical protein
VRVTDSQGTTIHISELALAMRLHREEELSVPAERPHYWPRGLFSIGDALEVRAAEGGVKLGIERQVIGTLQQDARQLGAP